MHGLFHEIHVCSIVLEAINLKYFKRRIIFKNALNRRIVDMLNAQIINIVNPCVVIMMIGDLSYVII